MFDRIIVGTDGSNKAEKAVRWASDLAKNLAAELLVVHVFETDPVKLPGGYVVLPEEQLNQASGYHT